MAVYREDLAVNPLGLPSRALEEIGEKPAIRRMVEGYLACDGVERFALLTVPGSVGPLARALEGLAVEYVTGAPAEPDRFRRWRLARKWSAQSARGGILDTSVFLEWGGTAELLHVLERVGADVLVKACALNPFPDPFLIRGGLDIMEKGDRDAVSAPGPAAAAVQFINRAGLEHILAEDLVYGELFQYNPERPARDPVGTDSFVTVPEEVLRARGRVSADSRRGVELCRAVAGKLAPAAGTRGPLCVTIDELVRADRALRTGRLPRELEIEVTGRSTSSAPEHPWSRIAARRGDMDPALLARILDQAAAYDDVLVTFGGHGDPLAHPAFGDLLRSAADRVWGVAVDTPGVLLDGAAGDLVAAGCDVVVVRLDAAHPGTYARLWGQDRLAEIESRIDDLREERATAGKDRPFILVRFTRRLDNYMELHGFWERWWRRADGIVIDSWNHFSGRVPDHAILPLTLSRRVPCVKLEGALFVLSDGKASICNQDYDGEHVVGDLVRQDLEEVWTGEGLERLRDSHDRGDWGAHALCGECRVWHQP